MRWPGVPTNRWVSGHIGASLCMIPRRGCCHRAEEEMESQGSYLAMSQKAAQPGFESVNLAAVSNQ